MRQKVSDEGLLALLLLSSEVCIYRLNIANRLAKLKPLWSACYGRATVTAQTLVSRNCQHVPEMTDMCSEGFL